uniref:Uncharacterized protein n=1 Tax=Noctiluca scintillans TaxID=2966 RepID=A0A6T8U5M8_NOCSC|mmetsp:Transcript_20133/g.53726  ORF Transcript_20133/g.53726 Transcript_20133/m.53726 type:complete len:126 (-) Transcript_20133:84-461(-)
MWWSQARYVACRNAHLNTWAQKLNSGLQGQARTMAASPLMRMCAEMRPAQGFAEQRPGIPGTLAGLLSGEALNESSSEAIRLAIAALLEEAVAQAAVNSASVMLATGQGTSMTFRDTPCALNFSS